MFYIHFLSAKNRLQKALGRPHFTNLAVKNGCLTTDSRLIKQNRLNGNKNLSLFGLRSRPDETVFDQLFPE